jgi:threonine/homoserine/homoserine lactone efflux protein
MGGVFLIYLGVRIVVSRPVATGFAPNPPGRLGAFASTFFLTITNPATILSFTAIFAGLGLVDTNGDYLAAIVLVIGIFSGSALWWLTLSSAVGLFRHKIMPRQLLWINRLAGGFITIFGFMILASIFGATA